MNGYTGVAADGSAVHYIDRKRWLWLLSVTFPLQPLLTIYLVVSTGNEIWVFFPFLFNYVLMPALDWLIGQDENNPPEEVVMQLDRDPYYRQLTYWIVPIHFLVFVVSAAFATTADLSWWAFTAMALFAGMAAGLAINTAHELGHKNSRFEKVLARVCLAIPAYGHFCVDHNRSHHKDVATFADASSARMGESIYRFARREIPGAFRNAWRIELQRLASRNLPAWHRSNPILQSYALSAALYLALIFAFGWLVLPYLLLHNSFAYWQLTSANYIEHYGLLRSRDAAGKLEKCLPHHSWNCNYVLSNLVLFHLERHSDHHAHPLRRYQSLRHFPDVPQLPNGYFGMYVLAYLPILWFRVMDSRLMALPHIDGDLDKANIEPCARPVVVSALGPRQDAGTDLHRLIGSVSLETLQTHEFLLWTEFGDVRRVGTMPGPSPSRQTFALVLIAVTASLIARAWLESQLVLHDYPRKFATDLSYLAVPVILALLTMPVWRGNYAPAQQLYRPSDLTLYMLIAALVVGLLFRIAAMAPGIGDALVDTAEFSTTADPDPLNIEFSCRVLPGLLLGLVVAAILTPLVEELVFRGYVLQHLRRHGDVVAVVGSTLLFTVFHSFAEWPIAIGGGILLGAQYLRSGSLWPSTVTHATFNAIGQLQAHCLWFTPADGDGAVHETTVAVAAALVFAAAITMIGWIQLVWMPGPQPRPGPAKSKRLGDPLDDV